MKKGREQFLIHLNEHWMPFTSNKDFKENPRLIVGAQGVYLKDHLGRSQIDASSGLYCNLLVITTENY